MSKIMEIFTGWYALLFKDSTPTIKNRLSTCKQCLNRNRVLNTCKNCGCYVPALCYYKHSKCKEWNEKNSEVSEM